ncbi:MAG: hypothetical protein IAF58_10115 [Leptolyngbya sp.]|nr:hypothetical protein [Candidatus Melainabacteria bacterium]
MTGPFTFLSYMESLTLPEDDRMIKVGDMLVRADVVSSSDITEAIQVSKRLNIPIGRVLISSGCVTEKLLHSALDLQSLIRDGEIQLESAVKALKRIEKSGSSVQDALDQLDFRPTYGKGKNNLVDLLIDSNLVSEEQVDDALKTSFEHGTPLGSTLVFQGALSPNFFPSISAIQAKVAKGELNHADAINELQAAFSLWMKAGDQTKQQALRTNDDVADEIVNLQRALQADAKVAAAPHADALEELIKKTPKAKKKESKEEKISKLSVFEETGDVSALVNAILESAPDASVLEDAKPETVVETINAAQKSAEIKTDVEVKLEEEKTPSTVSSEKTPVTPQKHPKREQVAAKAPRSGGRLVDLLSASGLLNQEDLSVAYQVMLTDSHRSASFLVDSGLISESARRNAERCHNLVKRGRLSPEQAISALKSSSANDVSLRDALTEQGVTVPIKLERDWQTGIAAGVVGGFLAALFSVFLTILRLLKKK